MKRYCKDVDLTDRKLIYRAVHDCLYGGNGKHRKPKFKRRDTIAMLAEYSGLPQDFLWGIARKRKYHYFDGIIDTIVDGIIQEIKDKNYKIKDIWYTTKTDECSGKVRRVGIQDIKQQLYDYIAVYALMEVLQKKIGYYQCSAIPGKGQLMGARAIKRWLRNKGMRYAWKADIRHFYESIDRDILKALLKRSVKNDDLLHLVFFLVDTFEQGLAIGSFLSQYLANFYLSYAYHFVEDLYKLRKCRDGTVKKVKLVYHELFYMDDILLMGKSLKDIKMAAHRFETYVTDELHIEIKEGSEYIDLRTGYIDMMGFKITRKNMTVRSRIFLRVRRTNRKVLKAHRKGNLISLHTVQALTSRYGWLANSDAKRYCKRDKLEQSMKIANNIIRGGRKLCKQ